jgi:hypothetical protein
MAAKTCPSASDLEEVEIGERNGFPIFESSYFVIVPSISEITTRSSSSHRKMREVQDATPEYEEETEKTILLAPCLSCSDFCSGHACQWTKHFGSSLINVPADPKSNVMFWRNISWYPGAQYKREAHANVVENDG